MRLVAEAIVAVAAMVAVVAIAKAPVDVEQLEIDRIIDRAIGIMAKMSAGTVEISGSYKTTHLDDGKQSDVTTWTRTSFHSSGVLLSETMSLSGSRSLNWSDGKVLRTLTVAPNGAYADGVLSEQTLLETDHRIIGGHRFELVSPLTSIASEIEPLPWRRRKYIGQQKIRGDVCDVIEISQQIQGWEAVRGRYAAVAESGTYEATFYISVLDSLVLRVERRGWTARGEIIDTREESDTDYLYEAALPIEAMSVSRFEAAMRGALGDKVPRKVQLGDFWKDKPLPEINLQTLDGRALRWEDFIGKVLVVETWFIGCTYCKYAFPYYDRMRQELQDRDVVFIALNTGDSETNSELLIRQWLVRSKNKYGFIWAKSDEPEEELVQKLQLKGSPTFFVVGRDGKVVMSYGGYGYGDGGEDPRLVLALQKAGVQF